MLSFNNVAGQFLARKQLSYRPGPKPAFFQPSFDKTSRAQVDSKVNTKQIAKFN